MKSAHESISLNDEKSTLHVMWTKNDNELVYIKWRIEVDQELKLWTTNENEIEMM